jgi:hypothetical protein
VLITLWACTYPWDMLATCCCHTCQGHGMGEEHKWHNYSESYKLFIWVFMPYQAMHRWCTQKKWSKELLILMASTRPRHFLQKRIHGPRFTLSILGDQILDASPAAFLPIELNHPLMTLQEGIFCFMSFASSTTPSVSIIGGLWCLIIVWDV